MGHSQSLFRLFSSFSHCKHYKLKKAQIVCLGFEPGSRRMVGASETMELCQPHSQSNFCQPKFHQIRFLTNDISQLAFRQKKLKGYNLYFLVLIQSPFIVNDNKKIVYSVSHDLQVYPVIEKSSFWQQQKPPPGPKPFTKSKRMRHSNTLL